MLRDSLSHSLTTTRSRPVRYGIAILLAAVATLLRLAFTPLIGEYAIPYTIFFPAVLLSAWYGGLGAAVLTVLLSTASAFWFFVYPARTLQIPDPIDRIALLVFLVVGFGMGLLSRSQKAALERAAREASQRRRAELDERLERERFETTLASIGDGVIATNPQGHVSFMNAVAETLTGWKRDEALGKPVETVFRIVGEDTRKPVQIPAVLAMQQGGIVDLPQHTILVARDGKEIPVDDSGSLIMDSEGRPSGAVLIFRDITERRRVEREREASTRTAHQLAAIVESSDDAILSKDMDLRIASWNRSAQRMFGYMASEVVGQPVTTIVPENRWSEEEEVMQSIRRGEKVERHETERRRKDGTIIPVSLTVSPIYDATGTIVGASSIMRDITGRRRAESEREESTRTAHQLAAIVESSDDAILSKNLDLRITSWNRAAERMLGFMASEAIGQSVTIIIPESRWSEESEVMQSIRRGEKVQHETERRLKDVSVIPVSLTVSPIHDATGTVVGASTTMRDMRRQRAVEKERHARRTAEEANRAKDEFLAVVSHELRNPLSSVLGWVLMLKQGQVPQERVPHALDVIERNVRAESQLVESLLDYSRIAADKLDLNLEGIDLSYLLEIVVDSMRPAAEAKGIKVSLTLADRPLTVVGDPARLQQVFSNLLTNALKFTSRGGQVQIRLIRRNSQAEVQVVDNGEGIQADFLPYIFERFRQADSAKGRAHGGLGLGLAIVRELADAHGGTVSAESRGKGKGSTFTVRIPIPSILPSNIKMATVHPAGEPVISGLRILVVDDEIDARELVTLALESRGAVIQQASSASEALDSLRREKPDLVISDIGMPHEDGYVLIQKLRAAEGQNAQPRLPAIALTAYASAADRNEALAAGYDLHLEKPVTLVDLVRAIGSVSREREIVTRSPLAEPEKPKKAA